MDQYTNVQTNVPGGCPLTGVNVIPLTGVIVAVRGRPAELVPTTVNVLAVPAGATAGVTVAEVMAKRSIVTVTENGAEPCPSLTVPAIVIVLIVMFPLTAMNLASI